MANPYLLKPGDFLGYGPKELTEWILLNWYWPDLLIILDDFRLESNSRKEFWYFEPCESGESSANE